MVDCYANFFPPFYFYYCKSGGPDEYYPDYSIPWDQGYCTNKRPVPTWGTYSSELACCKQAYAGQLSGELVVQKATRQLCQRYLLQFYICTLKTSLFLFYLAIHIYTSFALQGNVCQCFRHHQHPRQPHLIVLHHSGIPSTKNHGMYQAARTNFHCHIRMYVTDLTLNPEKNVARLHTEDKCPSHVYAII